MPVNYRLRGPEIAYVLNDSGARVVVAGPYHVVRTTHDGIDLGLWCRKTLAKHLDAEHSPTGRAYTIVVIADVVPAAGRRRFRWRGPALAD